MGESNWAQPTIDALLKCHCDESVTLVPRGNSMRPAIHSGATVFLTPVLASMPLSVGDIVLVDVPYVSQSDGRSPGTVLHFVKEIEKLSASGTEVYRIEDNMGRSNGWVKRRAIHGKVVDIVQPAGKV